MKPNSNFKNKGLDFWANTSLINQRLGYANKKLIDKYPGGFVIPSAKEIQNLYKTEGLAYDHIVRGDGFTEFGNSIIEYFDYRAHVLSEYVEKRLMNVETARLRYLAALSEYRPQCPLPRNNQGKAKGAPRYLNCLINMIAEQEIGNTEIDYNPMEMTSFTKDKLPIRSMTRRVDGAIPGVINPSAIWEIKEYYYTTTFGSKISDGIYATQLDGHELNEIKRSVDITVRHIMFVDGHYTWWHSGRSYLCRLIDIMHQNLVDEVMFGDEVLTEWPKTLREIKSKVL